jgi:hypothetical protein
MVVHVAPMVRDGWGGKSESGEKCRSREQPVIHVAAPLQKSDADPQ